METNVTASLYEHGSAGDNNTLDDDATLLVSLPQRPDLQVEPIIAPDTVGAMLSPGNAEKQAVVLPTGRKFRQDFRKQNVARIEIPPDE